MVPPRYRRTSPQGDPAARGLRRTGIDQAQPARTLGFRAGRWVINDYFFLATVCVLVVCEAMATVELMVVAAALTGTVAGSISGGVSG